jgi:hypothetical protein
METRSQTKYKYKQAEAPKFIVDIDFDDASECWKKNKKSIGNGSYKYICIQSKQDGTVCGNVCYKTSNMCWKHRNCK